MALSPEEKVRQQLIHRMTGPLGYPRSLIVVEKALNQLPHLQTVDLECPNRRLDLLCFGKDIHVEHPLYPLLLVECKAVNLTPKVINQVSGYNHYVGAYFVAIANQQQVQTGYYDPTLGRYRFNPGLPHYTHLLASLNLSP